MDEFSPDRIEFMKRLNVWHTGHFKTLCGECTDVFLWMDEARMSDRFQREFLFKVVRQPKDFLFVCRDSSNTKVIRSLVKMFGPNNLIYASRSQLPGEAVRFSQESLYALTGNPYYIVDDTVRKGLAAKELIAAARVSGNEPTGVLTLLSCGHNDINGIPVKCYINKEDVNHWGKDDCPLCQAGNSPHDPYYFNRHLLRL